MDTSIQGVVLKITGEHNHLPHPENVALKIFCTKVKQRVMKETTPIINIYEEVIASQMPPQTLATMSLARELRKDNTSLTQRLLYYKFHFGARFNIYSKKDDTYFTWLIYFRHIRTIPKNF